MRVAAKQAFQKCRRTFTSLKHDLPAIAVQDGIACTLQIFHDEKME